LFVEGHRCGRLDRVVTNQVSFFEKYRRENVGPTRARLAELITIFESEREAMTIRELEELREEIDRLTYRLQAERHDAERDL
jgi:hypothetical protein